MVILHITDIKNNPCNGVCIVVPQHIISQAKFAKVKFININNEKIDNLEKYQLFPPGNFDISSLEVPFNKPDLVVFEEFYSLKFLGIANQLKKNKIPYIIVLHGSLTQTAQKKNALKKKIANVMLFNRFVKNATAIQCLSQRELDTTNFGKKKFIGTNGIFVPKCKKEKFNNDKIKFVYIGRLDAFYKGLDLLVQAVSQIKVFLVENNCVFYIFGPDLNGRYKHLKGLIEKYNVENLININSAVTGKVKENLLLESDIFIQTSRSEGMPMGILEALSYGVPCLVTDGTNLGGLINNYDAGWVAETNAESIADRIKKAVMSREKYAIKSQNAVKLIENNFDWNVVSRETIAKYKKIVGE